MYGCPVQAVVQAYQWDERTIQRLQAAAGVHCQAVHEHLVEAPRDLGQVQVDEIWVKAQGMILWLAMALKVSTRLWLGTVVSPRRNKRLVRALLERVRRAALCRPLLLCVDGFSGYLSAIRDVFREPICTGKPGRPRLRPWDNICIAQVVKRYAGRRVVGVEQRLTQGPAQLIWALVAASQGGATLNIAYIERLNATFRSRVAGLIRRGRGLPRQLLALQFSVYLMGTVYNFCAYHRSPPAELALTHRRRWWLQRTPAIAARIADHKWSVAELLWFKVPKPPALPIQRGRPSLAWLALQKEWAT